MIIETFIDIKDLTTKQTLMVIDEQGKSWDVEEAINSSPELVDDNDQTAINEVTLERWIVQVGEPARDLPPDIAPILPRTYKNSIVLFRSLYACARLLPAWVLGKRIFSTRPLPNLPKLRYRILRGQDLATRRKVDHLSVPLYVGHENILEKFAFDPVDSPAGPISIHTIYRSNCGFRIHNSEEAFSSRFIGMDESSVDWPSPGSRREPGRSIGHHQRTVSAEVGSLPQSRPESLHRPELGQAYGSLSTFHQAGPQPGTSPMSALRAAQIAGSGSPEDSATRKLPPKSRSGQGSRSSLRSADGALGVGRRPSVSFMPFKSPALSASPSQSDQPATSVPKGSLGKNSPLAALAEARNPQHLTPSSRASPSANELAVPTSSEAVKPPVPSRFSSSFGHRKGKLSAGGSSKTEDDTSSGKASVISSNAAHPGSGVLAEGENSSGSLQADDDNISDFLKLLDQKKDLRSFRSASEGAEAEPSMTRNVAALNRYQRMKDSNLNLSESMSSSLVLHRSSTSSSQKISSVPAMVAGTSMSVSTSPGKPVSPHTPHTPAIPSRLSANSIIEYSNRQESSEDMSSETETAAQDAGQTQPSGTQEPSTGAIDIPTSPRPYPASYRRSSSAAQRRAARADDEDLFPFGLRSASLGVDDDRPPLSLSALANYPSGVVEKTETGTNAPTTERQESELAPMFDTTEPDPQRGRQESSGGREEPTALRFRGGPYRPRIGRGSGRGDTPPQDSSSSLVERGSGSGSSDQRGGRYSNSRPVSHFEDDEPLFFAMSDFGTAQPSRRSLEDSRGGGDSGPSSRRGSRRGGFLT